jgi:hypothetical protein
MGDQYGLLDVLNGVQNGPRGQRTLGSGGGRMSPMTIQTIARRAISKLRRRTQ